MKFIATLGAEASELRVSPIFMSDTNNDKVSNCCPETFSRDVIECIANTSDTVHDTMLAAIHALTLAQDNSSRSNDALIVMMNTLNNNIEKLIDQTKQTNDLIKNEGKLIRFQSALHHCHLGSFDYWEGGKGKQGKRVHCSEVLAQRILTSFFNGKAHAVPSSCHTGSHHSKGQELEDGKRDFRHKLVEQMEALVGHKIQLLDKGDGILHIICLS